MFARWDGMSWMIGGLHGVQNRRRAIVLEANLDSGDVSI